MSPIIQFLFLFASFICFIGAAFSDRARSMARVNLTALGLALFILVPLIQTLLMILA
jgi:hypothetical protein